MPRDTLTDEALQEYFLDEQRLSYRGPEEPLSMWYKHGTSYQKALSKLTPSEETEQIERKIGYKFPKDFIELITDNYRMSSGHVKNGWWSISRTDQHVVFLKHSLVFEVKPKPDKLLDSDEAVLDVHEKMQSRNIEAAPFAKGYFVDIEKQFFTKCYLALDKKDGSVVVISDEFEQLATAANDFVESMKTAAHFYLY